MKKKAPPSFQDALEKMRGVCAVSEQCSWDIRRKLFRMGLNGATIDKILDTLIEGRFIDDERFSRAFVRHSYRFSRWGRHKIAASLYAKHISPTIISSALEEEIDTDEYESTARTVLTSKAASIGDTLTYDDRMKLMRFGVSRGYEAALISKILKELSQ